MPATQPPKKLTRAAFAWMDAWMQANARPIDRAKWNHLFHNAPRDTIVTVIFAYQNTDGGLGHGFEPDVLLPASAAIPSAEAIFLADEYGLDMTAPPFPALFAYFVNSVQDIPKYWEDCPAEAMHYPHAPWWSYAPCTVFNPNPCAVVASALLRFGTPEQITLGERITQDCLEFLCSNAFCGDHDTLNCMALVDALLRLHSPLVTDEVMAAMKRRITENVCFDRAKWSGYHLGPLDYVSTPDSPWLDTVAAGIDEQLEFWLDSIGEDGVWMPNFTWGIDSEVARRVTEQWKGYVTVKRAKILRTFGRIESDGNGLLR